MARRVFNWTYKDVKKFLEKYDFIHFKTTASHEFYKGIIDDEKRLVVVPKHNNKAIKPRTFKSIIENSGISKDEWMQ